MAAWCLSSDELLLPPDVVVANHNAPDQVVICRDCGIEVVYLDTVLDSSSRLLKQFCEQQINR